MQQDRRGVLYPERLPQFHRLPAPAALTHAVRWVWIPEWNLPEGTSSRQELLPFPACNLVVEPAGISFTGPPTRRSERVLTGRGWAVGALLRPAAAFGLQNVLGSIPPLSELRDREYALGPVPDAGGRAGAVTDADTFGISALHETVAAAFSAKTSSDTGDSHRERAATAITDWIARHVPVPAPGSDEALANDLGDALADPAITRVDQLTGVLPASARTLQRVAERYFGLSLHSMIRRRRLQEGAARLREDPAISIAALATELGYADHAHFSTDFRALLGVTPSAYRSDIQK